MKQRKLTLVFLLVLTLCLSQAAPALATLTMFDGWAVLPNVPVAPPNVPVAPPNNPVTSPPSVQPTTPPNPALPQAEPDYGDPRLNVSVTPMEGPVGTTLTFSAALSGTKNNRSIALWVFRDGKRVAVFPSNRKCTWTYVAEEPGVYKGMAMHQDEYGSIYRSTKLVTIAAVDPPPQPPAETPPPAGPQPSAGEEAVSQQQQTMIGKGGSSNDEHIIEIRGTRNITFMEGGPAVPPIPLSYKQSGKWGSPITEITYNAFGLPPGFELVLKGKGDHRGTEIVCKTTNANYKWSEKEWEKTYTSRAVAICYHGVFGHSNGQEFTVTVLRDSNKNGIPDFYEQDEASRKLQIQPVGDIDIKDGQQFGGVYIVALHEGGGQRNKIGYKALLPNGMSQYYHQRPNGDYSLHINGTPLIDWNDEEILRRVPVTVEAFDEEGNKDSLTFHINVYRLDMDFDKLLYIVPVPKRTLVQGQKMVTTPITVLTNMKSNISLGLQALIINDDFELETIYEDRLPGRISPYTGPGSGWRETDVPGVFAVTNWQLHGPSSYLEKDSETGPNPFWWTDAEGNSQTKYYSIVASSQGVTASRQVELEVHRAAPSSQSYGLLPVANQVVMDDKEMTPIQLRCVQPDRGIKGLYLHLLSKLPDGVHFRADTGQIFGRPKITDWRMYEGERKFAVNIGSEIDSIKGVGFCLTVRRELEASEVALTPVADQQVEELCEIVPIRIAQVLPNPYKVTRIDVQGLPSGLNMQSYGAYCRISGSPNPLTYFRLNPDKTSLIFPCKVSCVYQTSDGRISLHAASFSFNIEVFKAGTGQKDPKLLSGPAVPGLHIDPIPNLRLPEGVPMEKIQFNITDESNSGIDVTVNGLPNGVQHDLKSTIYGTPKVENWANAEVDRSYQVLVEVVNDLGHRASTQFTITVVRAPVKIGSMPPLRMEHTPPDMLYLTPGDKGDTPSGGEKPDDKGEIPPGGEKPDDKSDMPPGGEKPDDTVTVPPDGTIPDGYEIPWITTIGTPEPEPLQPISGGGVARIAIAQWETDEKAFLLALSDTLAQMGYVNGQNIELKLYRANGNEQTARENLTEIGQQAYAMVIAVGDSMSALAQEHLQGRIPLIFAGVADPVKMKLTNSKGKGIGPVTGVIAPDLEYGLLLAIHRIQPEAGSAGLLSPADGPDAAGIFEKAPYAGLRIIAMPDIAQGEETLKKAMAGTDLLILTDEPEEGQMAMLMRLAAESGKALYARTASQVKQGAFLACLTDMEALGRHSAGLAAKLLKGEEAQSLPPVTSAGTTLVYNMNQLSALSLTVPIDAERIEK